jgi:Tol biopolymer transport system component
MPTRAAARRGTALIAIGAIALAIAAALSPSAAVAAFPGANGRIAFAAADPSEFHLDIFTVLPDGSGLQRLTASGAGQPAWSADGTRIAFIRGVLDGGYQVFAMSADGGDQTQLTHDDSLHYSPYFSPNGRRIVYGTDNLPGADSNTPRSIFTVHADGTKRRRLVAAPVRGDVAYPEYSPNGRRIVFNGEPKGRRKSGIWTMRPDGSRLRRLTDPESTESFDWEPDYSPDGRHIAFGRSSGDFLDDSRVYLMRADGSEEHPIPRTERSGRPAFAPAGDRIALSPVDLLFGTCREIFTISSAGSNPLQVSDVCPDTPGPGRGFATSPSWQPLPASQ